MKTAVMMTLVVVLACGCASSDAVAQQDQAQPTQAQPDSSAMPPRTLPGGGGEAPQAKPKPEPEAPAKRWEVPETPQALLDLPRRFPRGTRHTCPEIETVEYEGSALSYNRPLDVHPSFGKKLEIMDQIAAEAAREVYGRAPKLLVHWGGHVCRPISGRNMLSEHSFANAIDIAGFNFAADPSAPPELRDSFRVRLKPHWRGSQGIEKLHSRFLRLFVERVRRAGLFSVMLGPADPAHQKVLHFDAGPSSLFRVERFVSGGGAPS